jgi:hypothetical protein
LGNDAPATPTGAREVTDSKTLRIEAEVDLRLRVVTATRRGS